MDLKKLRMSDFVGFLGAGVLFLSLYLPWFHTDCDNPGQPRGCNENSRLNDGYGDFNAWEIFNILDYLFLAACVAPFILAYIIIRGHQLTWRPGEVTMIVGMLVIGLILCNGIILGKPGDSVEIGLSYGYLVGIIGGIGIMISGIIRQAEGRIRKPPGV